MAVAILVTAFNIWFIPCVNKFDPELLDHTWAVSFLFMCFVVWKGSKFKWAAIIGKVGFWFSVSNLADELFFNPYETGWNEYLFAIIVIMVTVWQTIQNMRK